MRTIVRGLSIGRSCVTNGIYIEVVNISQNLGLNIRTRRKELAISQEELARRCNIDRSYMGQIERGTANPSLAVIHAIAYSLVVSTSELLREYHSVTVKPPRK
jgi:predicted transcriptional regulator